MGRFTLSQMMRLPRLSEKLMVDREVMPEILFSKMGLYEGLRIETKDMHLWRVDGETLIGAGDDICALNSFLSCESIMLNCPECKKEMCFKIKMRYGSELRTEKESADETDNSKETRTQGYDMGNYMLGRTKQAWDHKSKEDLEIGIAVDCVDDIEEKLNNIRCELTCSLNSNHKGFADFIIYRAVDERLLQELQKPFWKRIAKDANAKRTLEEKKALSDFDTLETCLIMEKVGQYPSMADIQKFEIEKYRSIMSEESFRDLRRALGLYASGIGCGSFVYLRRILEGLVTDAANEAITMEGWDKDKFRRSDFNKKILYLESFGKKIIPDDLESVKSKIYGVLSKGVHDISDQECKEIFPILEFLIEELLDYKKAKKEKEKKLEQMNAFLEM